MKNLIHPAKSVKVTASSSYSSGDFAQESGFHGVVPHDVASGEEFSLRTVGCFWLTVSGATAGDLVYWTGSALTVSPGGSDYLIGRAESDTQTSGRHNGDAKVILLPPMGITG